MRWQIAGASVQGVGHIKHDLPCQDAHGYDIVGPYVVLCAADGLGTAEQADIGANEAVMHALHILPEWLRQDSDNADLLYLLQETFGVVHNHLHTLAEQKGSDSRVYATTLICVVIHNNQLAFGQVGDGGIVVAHGEQLELLGTPQQGEFANEVVPITAVDYADHLQVVLQQKSVDQVAVFTDGIQHLALDLINNEPFAPFFDPLFNAIAEPTDMGAFSTELNDFLASERVSERTDDDKTLVLASKLHDTDGSRDTGS